LLSDWIGNLSLQIDSPGKPRTRGLLKTKGPEFRNFHWQSGYGAFSIGQSQLAAVKRYIQSQKEHHRRVTFQEEFRKFLKRYEIKYDERYVWD
jgi:putative transposase